MTTALDRIVRVAAALGLDTVDGAEVDLDDEDVDRVVLAARREKVVGLLDQAVASGAVTASPAAAATIGEAASEVAAWCLLVERHALGLHPSLTEHGIEHRFLKGLTVAHRYAAHPALRSFADVDILVKGDQLDAATELLLADGHVRTQREWKRGFAARWGKGATVRSPAGVEVDLHRVLASGPFGVRARPEVLWDRPAATVALGGLELPCLDDDAAFVHACVHAVTGTAVHLASLRDVATILPRTTDPAVDDLAGRLGVGPCVTEAVRLAWDRLQLAPTARSTRLATRPVSNRERRWLDLYAGADRSFRRLALAAVPAVPGLRGKASYAWDLVRP